MVPEIARKAAKAALEFRLRTSVGLDHPCDIYEEIHRLGVPLQFMPLKTLDGMYLRNGASGQIEVSALRPSGQQRFTAAHELGHHLFGHGGRIDRKLDFRERFSSVPADEGLADMFARFALMPRKAVQRGFEIMSLDITNPTVIDVFRVSSWLGVGYTTLLHQMHWTLGMLSNSSFHELLTVRPQALKRKAAPAIRWEGRKEYFHLCPAWERNRVHAEVGDVFANLIPPDGKHFITEGDHLVAAAPGEVFCRIAGGGEIKVSVARTDFVGFYKYRYMEEED